MGLPPALCVTRGAMMFGGEDLLTVPPCRRRSLRGPAMSMIDQEPLAALNPLQTIDAQIDEVARTHLNLDRAKRRDQVESTLRDVRLNDTTRFMNALPHRLSGG